MLRLDRISRSGIRASHAHADGDAEPAHASRLLAAGVTLSVLVLWLMGAAPASASPLDRATASGTPELTRLEVRQLHRWWDNQVLTGSLALADVPLEELREAAGQALAAGVTERQLRSALFTEAARNVLAGNAAGGEGQPSPYLEYFKNNPLQLGRLGDFLTENPDYVVGPGGTQELLFERFSGLRESYLASLGLQEVDGRIVDPRDPRLTPYLASLLLGDPAPLPQPPAALNVATA